MVRRIRGTRKLALWAAAATAVPVGVMLTATPANAATGSLVVTTLGREGTKVATTVTVTDTHDLNVYTVSSGKKLSLPDATYDVMVDVYDPKDDTDTFGARVLRVTGATTTTIDARKGKPLTVSLDQDPGAGYSERVYADICATGGIGFASGENFGGHVYVIPDSSSHLQFAYLATWQPTSSRHETYLVSHETQGVPSGVSTTYRVAALAKVAVAERSGPGAGEQTDLTITPQNTVSNTDCRAWLFAGDDAGTTPWTTTAHVSPGRWIVRSDEFAPHGDETWDVGTWSKNVTLTAGESSAWTFYRSGFGPGTDLPLTLSKTLN